MGSESEQLITRVAEQVLAALGGKGVAAPIHPPIGVCTGDYSKFPELKGKNLGSRPAASAAPADKPLTGIVTARHLAGRGKTVRLASCARLTPLAADFVREHGIAVERGSAASGAASEARAGDLPWVWWCDGFEPGVERVTGQLRATLKPLGASVSSHGALADVVKKIAARVRGGSAAGGVLFVATAARAACYANRCPSLRAVVGTCPEAAAQGVEQLGANVLIVEHPYHGWKTMRQMVDRFTASPRPSLGDVDRHLEELATCV